MNKKAVEENICMMNEAKALIEKEDCPKAEALISRVIENVENSDFYKEDTAKGRVCFLDTDEKEIYEAYYSKHVEAASFPYAEMYRIKAESLIVNTECVSLMEEAHKWAPASYKTTIELIETYYKYGLYDRALEKALKAFRFVTKKSQEMELFYYIRRIGEGCWELTEEEFEDAEDAIRNMNPSTYAADFTPFCIPTSANRIKAMFDEEIDEIVRMCFPQKMEVADITPSSGVQEQESKCPYCGETKYYVTRENVTIEDAFGNQTEVEDSESLTATCFRCRNSIHVSWVEEKNKEEAEERKLEIEIKEIENGYKKADFDEVMKKYGIDKKTDLDDIITFCGFALDYSDDYDEGYKELIQDMYDIPAVFCACMDCAYMDLSDEETDEKWDRYFEKAIELSRHPCENLIPIYNVAPTLFYGTKEEPPYICINGKSIDEKVKGENPIEAHFAIERAIHKYNQSMNAEDREVRG